MGLNDITAVLVMGFPFLMYYTITSNKKLKYSILLFFVITAMILVGTKTGLAVLVLNMLFFMYQIGFKHKKTSHTIIIVFIILSFIVLFAKYFDSFYRDTILRRQLYFMQNNDFFTFLVSGRNYTLTNAFQYWNLSSINWILGLGFVKGAQYI